MNSETVANLEKEVHKLEEENYDLAEEVEEEKEMRRDIQRKMATGMSAAMKRSGGGGGMRRSMGGGGGSGGHGGGHGGGGRRRGLGSSINAASIDVKKAAADVEKLLTALVSQGKLDFEDWRGTLLGNLATLAIQFDDYATCAERFGAATAAFTGAVEAFNASTSEAASYNMIESSMKTALS